MRRLNSRQRQGRRETGSAGFVWRLAAAGVFACLMVAAPPGVQATFSGAPGKIAFQSTRAGGLSVWLANSDGSGLRQFTPGGSDRRPSRGQFAPAISRNGRVVAYVASKETRDQTWRNIFVKRIGVRDVRRSGRKVLRRPLPSAIDSVAFFPNGQIVFSAVIHGRGGPDFELYAIRLNGRRLRQLTSNRVQDVEPNVSVGGLIAFSQINVVGRPGLAVFGPANLAVLRPHWKGRRLLTRGRARDRDPSFAPYGNRVAFERSFRNNRVQPRIAEISVRRGGSRLVLAGERRGGGFDYPGDPSFSPEGGEIAVERTQTSIFDEPSFNPDLFAIDRRGLILRKVTGLAGDYDTKPDWGPAPRRR
jgi:Tol biopolymer transport system component